MKLQIIKLFFLISSIFLIGCENSESISMKKDHEVPTIVFSSQNVSVKRGTIYDLNVTLSDNVGLQSYIFGYSNWGFQASEKYNGEKNLSLSFQITIPSDAQLEWEEKKYRNDGSSYTATEQYHKFTIVCYDVNQNKRTSYFYIKVVEE